MSRDPLEKYNAKRNFEKTTEPAGGMVKSQAGSLSFVIQKHAATRLHYDFRLEFNGVLLSWAVPKGPSYFPEDKRLAVRTEDHPVNYRSFEGIIAANQYGAGPVMIWDRGTWEPLETNVSKALEKGKLHFRLHGERLKGEWALARMKGQKSSRENWLLIKVKDEFAIDAADDDFLTSTDFSVKSNLSFSDIAKGSAASSSADHDLPTVETESKNTGLAELIKKYHSPQLAILSETLPTGDEWVHEVKYDGYRIFVYCHDNSVRIHTRNGHNWTDRFPRLRRALEGVNLGNFVIDGEAVVLDPNGISDFKAMQHALGDENVPMQAFFFDILFLNGKDYTKTPFSRRRKALEKLFEGVAENPLFLSQIIEGDADQVFSTACDLELEGVISKKKSATYTQQRSKTWLKSKCGYSQEFIICGFTHSTVHKTAIGALHLGYFKNEKLMYAGKVGTGFSEDLARKLFKKLGKLATAEVPCANMSSRNAADSVWVTPTLLCEVKFAGWTASGKVRHASFKGLRADKKPAAIVREKPQLLARSVKQRKSRGEKCGGVTISHPERIVFPAEDITKANLADYYWQMADCILPMLKNRPISVLRCPEGIRKACFFQRTKGQGMSESIRTISLSRKQKQYEYFSINSAKGLMELIQAGTIEIHPWSAKTDNINKPDRLTFDLDPDENIPFEAIKLAAQDVKKRMQGVGLESFVRCTGGKGLHVVVPLRRTQEWKVVKDFTHRVAKTMAKEVPEAFTTNIRKANRKGKIFVDYLRNDFAATAVMDYCVRARTGANVAVPLHWDELETLSSASEFSIAGVLERKQNNQLFKPAIPPQTLTKDILNSF